MARSADPTQLDDRRLDEAARLEELQSLGVLDTAVEERFDQVTRLAADVMEAPTALISLVDEDRQWFKSRIGLECDQTPRSQAFCAHALPRGFLEVPDAQADPRFRDNPLVTGPPHIRAYAGVVLRGPTGQPLGALCLMYYEPRRLTSAERERLTALARLAETELNRDQDISAWARQLQHQALYDADTDLPGSSLFQDRMASLLGKAGSPDTIYLVHLRVANFDSLQTLAGGRAGSSVMTTLTDRLHRLVRVHDYIGRLSDDRLGLLLPRGADAPDMQVRIRQLVEQLAAPVAVGGTNRPIEIAAGISRYPHDAVCADALMDHARQAAGEPARGRVSIYYYTRENHERAARREDLAHRLADAFDADALQQVYQTIRRGQRDELAGVETLARWHDQVYGDISPADFVPLAEANPELRRRLTEWSLEKAVEQLAAWDRQGLAMPYVAVNVPAGELYSACFPEVVTSVLERYGVSPERLVLEITEQSLVADLETAVATMNALREQGVRFAIDDFGTGYSALSYLQKLPLDLLKIDRSFTRRVVEDATTRALTDGILHIARALGLTVVAEGIETPTQHEALQRLGCEYAQGFLFSRPVRAEQLQH